MEPRKFAEIIDACEYFPHYEFLRLDNNLKITLYLEEAPYRKKKRGLASQCRLFNVASTSYRTIIDWIVTRIVFIRSSSNYHIPECRDIAVKFFKKGK